jgi:hypothetical protein
MAFSEPPRDVELEEIQRLYRQLTALPFHRGTKRETPEYKALIVQIRAIVDRRTKIRGDEMIAVIEKGKNFKG